jgi:rubredoxin
VSRSQGRPRVENPKTSQIKVAVTDETRRILETLAGEDGVSTAHVVRRMIDREVERMGWRDMNWRSFSDRRPRELADLEYLARRGVAPREMASTRFFALSVNWRCPVCGAHKYDLVHRRQKGWSCRVEEHHHGPELPGAMRDGQWTEEAQTAQDRYARENQKTLVCYLCNGTERDLREAARKAGVAYAPMGVSEMRASEEFRARRAAKKVRDS